LSAPEPVSLALGAAGHPLPKAATEWDSCLIMGSEILDSSGGTRSVAPGLAVEPPRELATPVVDLEELQPVRIDPRPPGPARTRSLASLRRLWSDPDRRRTAIRSVVAAAVLVALTTSVVEFRAGRDAAAERAGRVAVDIRLDEVHPASRSFELNGAPAEGTVTARVELHNLGPEEVRLLGLDVTRGGTVQIPNNVTDTPTLVGPGRSSDTTYNLRLPCRPDQQRGFGSPDLTARVRTVDGQVHAVPVNLSAVNVNGGLLTACISDTQEEPDAVTSYSSTSDGNSVAMTIVVGGDQPRQVSLVTPNVGVEVRYVSTPRLPATAQPDITFVVKVTPEVVRCSRTPVNFDALPGVSVKIGSEAVSDTYLPALVAQAAGRACGAVRR
jgi:hypothetical protein